MTKLDYLMDTVVFQTRRGDARNLERKETTRDYAGKKYFGILRTKI
jgi:hypothetical protein